MGDNVFEFRRSARRSLRGYLARHGFPSLQAGEEVPGPTELSLQVARLRRVHAELSALYEDELLTLREQALPFHLVEKDDPRLYVDGGAVISIDQETGLFAFCENAAGPGMVVVTCDGQRLVDLVISCLVAGKGAFAPQTAAAATRLLIGQPLAEVERRLVLQTLRHYHGDRARAAEALGLTVRTLREKLTGYRQSDKHSTRGGLLK